FRRRGVRQDVVDQPPVGALAALLEPDLVGRNDARGKPPSPRRGADANLDIGRGLQHAARVGRQIDRPARPLEHALAPADLDRLLAVDARARLAAQQYQAALAPADLPVQLLARRAAIDLEADIFPARALRRDRQRQAVLVRLLSLDQQVRHVDLLYANLAS